MKCDQLAFKMTVDAPREVAVQALVDELSASFHDFGVQGADGITLRVEPCEPKPVPPPVHPVARTDVGVDVCELFRFTFYVVMAIANADRALTNSMKAVSGVRWFLSGCRDLIGRVRIVPKSQQKAAVTEKEVRLAKVLDADDGELLSLLTVNASDTDPIDEPDDNDARLQRAPHRGSGKRLVPADDVRERDEKLRSDVKPVRIST